jgi:hypothetical protein
MLDLTIYAPPREITSLEDCTFYHTMDIPGHGVVQGHWDLRPNVNKYLGGVDLKGKRVLEVGTANGYLCFHMERQGADVVAFDLSHEYPADVVPFARWDHQQGVRDHKGMIKQLNNAWWLAHRAFDSKAHVVYGTAYNIPAEIGPVDIATFGAILLHLRDPFFALQNAAKLTRETIIVTEPLWSWSKLLSYLSLSKLYSGYAIFVPQGKLCEPKTGWWQLSPAIIQRFLHVLGFEDTKVSYHRQMQTGGARIPFFTVVGRRTVPLESSFI